MEHRQEPLSSLFFRLQQEPLSLYMFLGVFFFSCVIYIEVGEMGAATIWVQTEHHAVSNEAKERGPNSRNWLHLHHTIKSWAPS